MSEVVVDSITAISTKARHPVDVLMSNETERTSDLGERLDPGENGDGAALRYPPKDPPPKGSDAMRDDDDDDDEEDDDDTDSDDDDDEEEEEEEEDEVEVHSDDEVKE